MLYPGPEISPTHSRYSCSLLDTLPYQSHEYHDQEKVTKKKKKAKIQHSFAIAFLGTVQKEKPSFPAKKTKEHYGSESRECPPAEALHAASLAQTPEQTGRASGHSRPGPETSRQLS